MAPEPQTIPRTGWAPETEELRPDEEVALEAQLERVREEKRLALDDPGPSWREWFLFHGAKWYVALGFLVVLSWEVLYVFPPTNVSALVVAPVIVVTLYADVVLWQYLWYRPHGASPSLSTRHAPFRSRLLTPFVCGRWTPEAAELRAGRPIPSVDGGPDPREFL